MQTHAPQPQQPEVAKPEPAPNKSSSGKSLAIALLVASVFLLAAIAIVVWLFITRSNGQSITGVDPNSDTKNVKTVEFVAPDDLLAKYAKNDQSKNGDSTVFYYDDASACGVTSFVAPVTAAGSLQELVIQSFQSLETKGVTVAGSNAGPSYKIKDSSNGKTYTFDSVELTQDVKALGIDFTKQNNVILYKQIGTHVAALGYACKDQTWASKKDELTKYINEFTVRTTT